MASTPVPNSSVHRLVAAALLILACLFASGDAHGVRNSRSMNVIDRCWRRNPNWSVNRQRLAMCSVGFVGKMTANRGRAMTYYTVTDPSDDPISPRPGTLRYGCTMLRGKVWITFQHDMQIKLVRPLLVGSFTTIDGRGAQVHITQGAGFVLNRVSNVIIHGLHFHDLRTQPGGPVMGPGRKMVQLSGQDGDAIRLVGASKVWIDHNTLYRCQDGLIDVTLGSTAVTISNNWFKYHDKVMLLGHDDAYLQDRQMKVTVAFNRFGPGCNQRMPRIRHGYAHVVNNFYDGWGDYAIGGSMNPSVKSQANFFVAPQSSKKKVTWKVGVNMNWNWRSVNDLFTNGAFFKQAGSRGVRRPGYTAEQSFPVGNAKSVRPLTQFAGVLSCSTRARC